MAIPFLYGADDATNDYTKNGFGAISDCTTLLTTAAINGETVLSGSIPVGKPNTEYLINGNIVKLKINDTQQPQIMRLFNVKKSMASREITFSAEPISNDLRENFLPSFKTQSLSATSTFDSLRTKSKPAIPTRFKFYSDKANTGSVNLERVNVLEALGGVSGSILQIFKGEYERDNHNVYLRGRLGSDHKIKIIYTKNLTGLDIEISTQRLVNGIYGFANPNGATNGNVIEGTKQITYFEKQYSAGTVKPVDFSNDKPSSSAALQKLIDSYIKSNSELNTPKVSAKIDFVLLNKQPEYREFVNMETVGLGDGVDVYHPDLEVDLHARVVGYEYDSITEQYTKIEIGSVRANFVNQIVDKISENNDELEGTVDYLKDAVEEATDIIKNPGEGHVVIYPSMADPQEILIMDTKDVNTAKSLWRFNQGGLAFSRTGYNGTYELAMTNNGAIVADRITTGTLRAINIIGVTISGANITGGKLTSDGSNFTTTIENGVMKWVRKSDNQEMFRMYPMSINSGGSTIGFKLGSNGFFKLSGSSNNDTKFSFGEMASAITTSLAVDIRATKNSNTSTGMSISSGNDLTLTNRASSGMSQVILRTGNTSVVGSFSVSGSKNSLVRTMNYGERLLNAYETPEYLFATYGKAKTNKDGYVQVEIEPMFLETIDTTSKNYHVFVSPYENSTAYACFLEKDRFLIKTDKPSIEVSYQLVAYRKGYEEFYLETPKTSQEKIPSIEQFPLDEKSSDNFNKKIIPYGKEGDEK